MNKATMSLRNPAICVMVGALFASATGCEPTAPPEERRDSGTPGSGSEYPRAEPADPAAERREVEVSLTVPDLGWSIAIERVYRVDDELWVISRVRRPEGPAGQAITTAEDSVTVAAPANLPARHFVLGKTWEWDGDEPYEFIDSMDQIAADLDGAELHYDRDEPLTDAILPQRGYIPMH